MLDSNKKRADKCDGPKVFQRGIGRKKFELKGWSRVREMPHARAWRGRPARAGASEAAPTTFGTVTVEKGALRRRQRGQWGESTLQASSSRPKVGNERKARSERILEGRKPTKNTEGRVTPEVVPFTRVKGKTEKRRPYLYRSVLSGDRLSLTVGIRCEAGKRGETEKRGAYGLSLYMGH